METSVLFSGFGGQGILFMGKFFSYYGLLNGYEVSWMPSYGAEMRGGTANCGVRISKTQIGSPVVANPDILVCMSLQTLTKYGGRIKPGGEMFADNTAFTQRSDRTDITAYYLPATKTADENGISALANMIMMGKILTVKNIYDPETVKEAMKRTVPERRKDMFEANIRAIEIGTKL